MRGQPGSPISVRLILAVIVLAANVGAPFSTSRLGRVFLDWAQYPVVEVEHLSGDQGYIVRFLDLRFNNLRFKSNATRRRRSILSGTVVLDSKLNVVDMYMGEK